VDQREEGEEINQRIYGMGCEGEVLLPPLYRRRGAAAPWVVAAPRGAPTSSLIHVGGHSTHKFISLHSQIHKSIILHSK